MRLVCVAPPMSSAPGRRGGGSEWSEFVGPTRQPGKNIRPDNGSKPTNQLSSKDRATIDKIISKGGRHLSIALSNIEEIQKENDQQRKEACHAMQPLAPVQGRWAQCVSFIASVFQAKKASFSSLAEFDQKQILRNVERLQQLFKSVESTTREIQTKYQGYTFTRDENTPRALVLAAIPTEKVGTLPNHLKLMANVDNFVRHQGVRCRLEKHTMGRYLKITRMDKNGDTETLEICYRRPGKVDVMIRNKNGATFKSVWNDDAEKLAKGFAKGKTVKFVGESKVFRDYTILSPNDRSI